MTSGAVHMLGTISTSGTKYGGLTWIEQMQASMSKCCIRSQIDSTAITKISRHMQIWLSLTALNLSTNSLIAIMAFTKIVKDCFLKLISLNFLPYTICQKNWVCVIPTLQQCNNECHLKVKINLHEIARSKNQ